MAYTDIAVTSMTETDEGGMVIKLANLWTLEVWSEDYYGEDDWTEAGKLTVPLMTPRPTDKRGELTLSDEIGRGITFRPTGNKCIFEMERGVHQGSYAKPIRDWFRKGEAVIRVWEFNTR